MRYFTNEKTISAIKRLTYTGSKATASSVGTATGYLRPLSADEASLNGVQHGQAYQLIVETDVDIRPQDRVTISSVDYLVRGVANHDRGGPTAYKACLVTLPQDD